MTKRRDFLKKAALGSAAFSFSSLACAEKKAQPKTPAQKNWPIVVATWDNQKAVAAAAEILRSGGSALDAVEAGARVPEADPNDTSVGLGGRPDARGRVTLDACVMDEKGRAGSVVFVQNFLHPVSIARAVMEKTPHVILAGAGAEEFAEKNGFEKAVLLTKDSEEAWKKWLETDKNREQWGPKATTEQHDTIGILAIDAAGRISGACTTSGAAFKLPGRVGDSPVIGAGLFVDGAVGAATCSGMGELMLRNLTSFLIVELMRSGLDPQAACESALRRMGEKEDLKKELVAVCAVDKWGRVGSFSSKKGFKTTVFEKEQTTVSDSKTI